MGEKVRKRRKIPPIAEGIALKKFPTKKYDTFLLR
jgi:hypothetical protein